MVGFLSLLVVALLDILSDRSEDSLEFWALEKVLASGDSETKGGALTLGRKALQHR